MDPSLLEQFLGPSSTQLQLPPLKEDENDELRPLLNVGFQRLSHTRKSLPGKTSILIQDLTHSYISINSLYVYLFQITFAFVLHNLIFIRSSPLLSRNRYF